MMFPEPKYVIFSEILLHPTFGTKISGLPYFYSVKLDVIGFGQKAHFWNREGPYNAAMHLVSLGVGVPYPKFIESWCAQLRPNGLFGGHHQVRGKLRPGL